MLRLAEAILRAVAPEERRDDLLGDLQEAHQARTEERSALLAHALTLLEAADLAAAVARERLRGSAGRGSGIGAAGTHAIGFSWLDLKLGARMLRRYPGFTIVGGLAMAFAVWVGGSFFEFGRQLLYPELPFDEGDRIVGIRDLNAATGRAGTPRLHDFHEWRLELRTVEDVGAYRAARANLITGDGRGEPVVVAQITASAFRTTRVPPLLGRTLVDADEAPGAPSVVVLGHDVWRTRFGGDPDVVGRTVGLDRDDAIVVGVMPEGYAFPVSHEAWTPLRMSPVDFERAESPRVAVFGRLATDVTLDEAQVEITQIGERATADYPEIYEHIRPQVVEYTRAVIDFRGLVAVFASLGNLFIAALVALICGNVALLLFARAAARETEIVVRTALGASRGRIVGQLFAEALVLGGLAALVGLAAVRRGLEWGLSVVRAEVLEGEPLPFWLSDTLSPQTVVYVAGLAVLGAGVAGVLPALRLTRGQTGAGLQRNAAGGGVGFGRLWSVASVLQIALMVVFVGLAVGLRADIARLRGLESGFSGHEHLAVRLQMDRDDPRATADGTDDFASRFEATARELREELLADPAVMGVTIAERLPRMYHPWRQVEIEGGALPPPDVRGHRMGAAAVDPHYFEVLGASIAMGRGFGTGDVGSDPPVVIVNEPFVERVLGGRNPIGRRIRLLGGEDVRLAPDEPGPWLEIVGVVPDLGATSGYGPVGYYVPRAPGEGYPLHLAIALRGDPAAFGPRVRAAALEVDRALRIDEVLPLDQVNQGQIVFYRFWSGLTTILSAVALLLSMTGVYSLMSYTVSGRTREIGVRVALGSDRRRIVLAIFRRPLLEVAIGVLLGSAVVAGGMIDILGTFDLTLAAGVCGYAVLMFAVCMLACVVPTRRALGVEPVEALRAEG